MQNGLWDSQQDDERLLARSVRAFGCKVAPCTVCSQAATRNLDRQSPGCGTPADANALARILQPRRFENLLVHKRQDLIAQAGWWHRLPTCGCATSPSRQNSTCEWCPLSRWRRGRTTGSRKTSSSAFLPMNPRRNRGAFPSTTIGCSEADRHVLRPGSGAQEDSNDPGALMTQN